ncbi:heme-binding protein 2-like [Mobula birostris]|uniref:heme-binding protein 2-like n=1 Tax=Mobula birostris TaxID=1983395 RepID=UPI003B27DE8D
MSPIKCQFGYPPVLFLEQEAEVEVPVAENLIQHCNQKWIRARGILLASTQKAETKVNQERRKGPTLQPGQQVWLSTHDLPLRMESRNCLDKNHFKLSVKAKLSTDLRSNSIFQTTRTSNSRPVHCREVKKCFNYDLICENSGYEVRHYNSSTWIATNVTSFFMEFASYEGFTKLFQYIQGKNEEGKKINMAAPVLLKIPESERIMEMKNYTVHFLLPEAYQENPPTPTDPDVYFIEFPKMYVFVKSFGGSLLTWNSKFYSSRLKAELNKADQSFISDYYYGTGYNRPKTLFDQHNEVWYVAEGTPECSTLVPELTA